MKRGSVALLLLSVAARAHAWDTPRSYDDPGDAIAWEGYWPRAQFRLGVEVNGLAVFGADPLTADAEIRLAADGLIGFGDWGWVAPRIFAGIGVDEHQVIEVDGVLREIGSVRALAGIGLFAMFEPGFVIGAGIEGAYGFVVDASSLRAFIEAGWAFEDLPFELRLRFVSGARPARIGTELALSPSLLRDFGIGAAVSYWF